jgi:hypothetical protein
MTGKDASVNEPRLSVEALIERLVANGVIGPNPPSERPVAAGQVRPRPRRPLSDLISDWRR